MTIPILLVLLPLLPGSIGDPPPIGPGFADPVPAVAQLAEDPPAIEPSSVRPEVVLELSSGEWIRGTLRSMLDAALDFDSDKMGVISIDYDDVRRMESTVVHEFLLRSDERVVGYGHLRGENFEIERLDGDVESIPKYDVLAIYPAGRGLRSGFRYGKVSLGLDQSRGNIEDQSLDFLLRYTQQSGSFQTRVTAQSNYGKSNGVEYEKRHEVEAGGLFDINRWFYVVALRGDYTYDRFQNIDARVRAGAGPGVTFYREVDLVWRFEVVPSYGVTKYRDVEPGESDREDVPLLLLSNRINSELTDDIDLVVQIESYLGLRDLADTTHSVRFELSYELIDDLTLDLRLNYDRVEQPVPREDGTVPDQDDVKWFIGIGYEF